MSLKRKSETKLDKEDGVKKRNKTESLLVSQLVDDLQKMIERNYPEYVFLEKASQLEKIIDPNDTMVLLLKAKFYLARGHTRKVKECVNHCYLLNQNDINTREFCIRWRLKSSDTEKDNKLKNDNLRKAMRDCVWILNKTPDKIAILYLKGLTHHQLAQHQQAIIEFEKCFGDEPYGLKSVWQAYHSLMCMIRLKFKTNEDKKKSFMRALTYLDKVLTMSLLEADTKMVKENQEWINRKLEEIELDQKNKEKEKEKEVDSKKEKEDDQEKLREKEIGVSDQQEKPQEKIKDKEKDILDQMALMGPIYQCHAATMAEQQMNQSSILELLKMKPEECDSMLMGSLGFNKLHCIVFRNRFSPK